MYVLVYDIELCRPGCVLLQTALGGTVPNELFIKLFPAESWLLAPTSAMQTYSTTPEQLQMAAAKTLDRL